MFEPQNDLERSLIAATTDPAARPQFYRDLVASDLFVVQEPDTPSGQLNIRPLEVNGNDCLPVFSSLPRLQAFIDQEVSYIAMNARDFMQITRGARLLLNAGSDYGKELLPEEIASILDGSIWQPQSRL
jgi:SseB protein N-terminal domain